MQNSHSLLGLVSGNQYICYIFGKPWVTQWAQGHQKCFAVAEPKLVEILLCIIKMGENVEITLSDSFAMGNIVLHCCRTK